MPLYKRSHSHFEPEERDRGTDCFRDGRVIVEIDGPRARAVVGGAEDEEQPVFRVGIDWTRIAKRRVHTYCECDRFAGGQLCSHIWAVLLALSEAGAEHQPAGRDRLGLRKDQPSRWNDLTGVNGGQAGSLQGSTDSGRTTATRSDSRRPPLRQRVVSASSRRGRKVTTSWRSHLSSLRDELSAPPNRSFAQAQSPRPPVAIEFAINTAASQDASGLVLDVFGRATGASGKPGKLKRIGVEHEELEELLLPSGPGDASGTRANGSLALVTEMLGTQTRRKGAKHRAKSQSGIRRLRLPSDLYEPVLLHLCDQRTLNWWDGRAKSTLQPLRWDAISAWQLALHLEVDSSGVARLGGALERNGDSVPLGDPVLILSPADSDSTEATESLVVFNKTIGRLKLDRRRDLPWITLLRSGDALEIPEKEVGQALSELLELPVLPRLEIPSELDLHEEAVPPQPRLRLEPAAAPLNKSLVADLSFEYGPVTVSAEDGRSSIVDWETHAFLRRDMEREHAALVRLLELGLRAVEVEGGVQALELDPEKLPSVLEPLLQEDWIVQVEGRSVSSPSTPTLRIESGIDWFDLSGEVDFAGNQLELTKVLDAVSRGESFIQLEDGSQGLLPASWMETYDSLA
ncbi:MAG: SNF2 helicase associated domain-containing protein, partial [Acidobacteriota bacterium]